MSMKTMVRMHIYLTNELRSDIIRWLRLQNEPDAWYMINNTSIIKNAIPKELMNHDKVHYLVSFAENGDYFSFTKTKWGGYALKLQLCLINGTEAIQKLIELLLPSIDLSLGNNTVVKINSKVLHIDFVLSKISCMYDRTLGAKHTTPHPTKLMSKQELLYYNQESEGPIIYRGNCTPGELLCPSE